MSKSTIAPLTSLDPAALETAAGGRRAASSTSSRRASDTAILDALQDVEDAIRDMGRSQSQNNNQGNDMMMALLMSKLGNNNAQQPVVVCGNGRKRRC